MLAKNRDPSLLNSSGTMTETTCLTERETKRKEYLNYGEFNSHTNEKVERRQKNSRL